MRNYYRKNGLLRIDMDDGYSLPLGYGIAYFDYQSGRKICYPIGLNWIVWFVRELYFKIGRTPNGIEIKSYRKGYNEGFKKGMEIKEDEYRRKG